MFEIDPAFRNASKTARARQKARGRRRLALGAGGALLIAALGLAGFASWRALAPDPGAGTGAGTGGDAAALDEGLMMIDALPPPDAAPRRDASASFVNLRRDPMILRLASTESDRVESLAGPADFAPDRAGPARPGRLAILRDDLFVSQQRLVTAMPSSRDDFALFQAQRAKAISERSAMGSAGLPGQLPAPEGRRVAVTEAGSFGSLIAGQVGQKDGAEADGGEDGGGDDGGGDDSASYVETAIANTTSVVMLAREDQRLALFEDHVVVLASAQSLAQLLAANGLPAPEASRAAAAIQAQLPLPAGGDLAPGSLVAMRLGQEAPGPAGRVLMQVSLYGAAEAGYLGSVARLGAGRYAASADPWAGKDLLALAADASRSEGPAQRDLRLLDALYSAALRNGLPTDLTGAMIALMSKRYDLERVAAEGDQVTLLYARPGAAGAAQPSLSGGAGEAAGLGRLFYIGIRGPSGVMPCYVVAMAGPGGAGPGGAGPGEAGGAGAAGAPGGGFDCFAPGQGGVPGIAGGIGNGLIVPVNGVRSSGFGPRFHPILKQIRNHNGVDWAAPTGTPVFAAAAGVVAFVGNGGDYGNVVYIDHAGGRQTRYAHLDAFARDLHKGQSLGAGDPIGFVGTTGRSTGPHLHFELYQAGSPIDPMEGAGGSDAVEALVAQIVTVESGGDARARNSRSTATGLGQFIDSTWLRMMRDYRPDLFGRMDRTAVLDLRLDPALSREMVAHLARENEAFLRGRGLEITPGRLYLAHFLGPAGAEQSLRADPAAAVQAVMGAQVVAANPFLAGKTIADLRAWADGKMAGMAGRASGGAAGGGPGRAAPAQPVPPEVAAFRAAVDAILGPA